MRTNTEKFWRFVLLFVIKYGNKSWDDVNEYIVYKFGVITVDSTTNLPYNNTFVNCPIGQAVFAELPIRSCEFATKTTFIGSKFVWEINRGR